MDVLKKLAKYLLPTLPFALVFLATLYHPFDSDMGWHLKYGEHFFQQGSVLRDNTFSTMMTDYKWPNSSWGTDLVSYFLFNNFGFLGISVGAAVVITLSFYFMSRAAGFGFFERVITFPLYLYFLMPINVISFRGQIISLLFVSVLAYLLRLYQEGKKKSLFFLVPLFLLWSNMHGQFAFGLGIFAMWAFFYMVIKLFPFDKKGFRKIFEEGIFLGAVFMASALACIVNPFGTEVYKEAIKHFANPYMKFIYEWLPFEERSGFWWNQIVAGLLLFFGVIYISFTGKFKEKFPWIGTVLVLYILSFTVRRYSWPMYYLTFPVIVTVAEFFRPPNKKAIVWASTIISVISLVILLFGIKPQDRIRDMSWNSYCRLLGCPIGALQFMKDNQINGKLLSFYDWGGFMIWNYPDIKPSIDGRMHLWRDKNGYSAFAQYYPIEQDRADVNDTDYNIVLIAPHKPLYDQMLDHVDDGSWRMVYEDDFAGIFVRN